MENSRTHIAIGTAALHYWLHAASRTMPLSKRDANAVLSMASIPRGRLPLDHSTFGTGAPSFLVGEHCNRSVSESHRFCSFELPAGSIYPVASNVYIASPEFAFLLLAPSQSLCRLAEIGTNLCASYRFHHSTNAEGALVSAIIPRTSPITSPEKLRRFAESMPGFHGRKAALAATRFVRSGAESPMEIKTMLLLTLPARLGGYGLGTPDLNRIVRPGNRNALANQGYYKLDICYPNAKVGIEFDGFDYHQDFAKDRRRINALEALGWTIVSVDKQQLYSPERFEQTARQIAKLIGKRIDRPANWHGRMMALRRNLHLAR